MGNRGYNKGGRRSHNRGGGRSYNRKRIIIPYNRVNYHSNYIYPNYSPSYSNLYSVTAIPTFSTQYYDSPVINYVSNYVQSCKNICAQNPFSHRCYRCRLAINNVISSYNSINYYSGPNL